MPPVILNENEVDMSSMDKDFLNLAVNRGFINQEQAQECMAALKAAAEHGLAQNVEEILVKKGFLTENQIKELSPSSQKSNKEIIPGYEIIAKLGQGGMGAVYKARQLSMERIVALKILPKRLAKNQEFSERFIREARLAAKVNHPNIIGAIDVGEVKGINYFAMEFIDGKDCSQLLKESGGKFPESKAAEIITQTLEALAFAHNKNIIHRDIKPENIMIKNDGTVKLADLGLAKSTAEDSSLTATGTAFGTPRYISPEQAKGEKNIDGRTDLYSLGATLFHFVTGQPPFDGDTAASVMTKHITEQLPNIQQLNPNVSIGMINIIKKFMQKNPKDRFQNAEEAIKAFANREAFGTGRPAPVKTAEPPTQSAPKPSARQVTPKKKSGESIRHQQNDKSKSPMGLIFGIGIPVVLLVIGLVVYLGSGSPSQNNIQKNSESSKTRKTSSPTSQENKAQKELDELRDDIKSLERKSSRSFSPKRLESYFREAVKLKNKAKNTVLEQDALTLHDKILQKYAKVKAESIAEDANKQADLNNFAEALKIINDFPILLKVGDANELIVKTENSIVDKANKLFEDAEKKANELVAQNQYDNAIMVYSKFTRSDYKKHKEQAESEIDRLKKQRQQFEMAKIIKAKRAEQNLYWGYMLNVGLAIKQHNFTEAENLHSKAHIRIKDKELLDWIEKDKTLIRNQKELWESFIKEFPAAASKTGWFKHKGKKVKISDKTKHPSTILLHDQVMRPAGSINFDNLDPEKKQRLIDLAFENKPNLQIDQLLLQTFVSLDEEDEEPLKNALSKANNLWSKVTPTPRPLKIISRLANYQNEIAAEKAYDNLMPLYRNKQWSELSEAIDIFQSQFSETEVYKTNLAQIDDMIADLDKEYIGPKDIFSGQVKRLSDGRLELFYDFSDSSQAKDWCSFDKPGSQQGPAQWHIRDGKLYEPSNISIGDTISSAYLNIAKFAGDCEISFVANLNDDDGLYALLFCDSSEFLNNGYTSEMRKEKGIHCINEMSTGELKPLDSKNIPFEQNTTAQIEFISNGNTLQFKVNGQVINNTTLTSIRKTGYAGIGQYGFENLAIDNLKIVGRLDADWLKSQIERIKKERRLEREAMKARKEFAKNAEKLLQNILHCKVEKTQDNKIRLTYDFSDPDQLEDFTFSHGRWLVDKGTLKNPKRTDNKIVSSMQHVIPFAANCKISVANMSQEKSRGVIIGYSDFITVFGHGKNPELVIMKRTLSNNDRNDEKIHSDSGANTPATVFALGLNINSNRIDVSVNNLSALSHNVDIDTKKAHHLWIEAGYKGEEYQFDNLVIEGLPDKEWTLFMADLEKAKQKMSNKNLKRGLIGTYSPQKEQGKIVSRRIDYDLTYRPDQPVTGLHDYSIVYKGYIYFPAKGQYTFQISHDDDFYWRIDGKPFISSPGWCPPDKPKTHVVEVNEIGFQPLTIAHWDNSGKGHLYIRSVSFENSEKYPPIKYWLFHDNEQAKFMSEKW